MVSDGPSRLVLPYPATLASAVEKLVTGARSDLESIQLFRKSIAGRQLEMLRESLDNLERGILPPAQLLPKRHVSALRKRSCC